MATIICDEHDKIVPSLSFYQRKEELFSFLFYYAKIIRNAIFATRK